MESETEEDGVSTYKNKYRQLKSRLKYLIYEHECFENDIQKAQAKLLQLSRDKSFLLDQLMRYEAVVLSGAEEETDYSSGDEALPPSSTLQPTETEKTDSGSKSDVLDHSAKPASLPSSVQASQLTKQGVAKTTSLLQAVATNASSKTSTAKTGGVRKTKASTKVSAVAAAKITKAVARARQNPQNVPPASPLIVSLPLDGTSLGGRSKQPQAPPTKPLHLSTLTSMSSTAAILASIPVPPKPPTKVITAAARPSGKGLSVITATRHSGRSSSSSSSSSSDSEDSRSESSSSSSSKEEPMEAGGPVPIVHSVPIPAGGPQLVRPKAILSPVKAPPQLIPVAPASSSSSSSTITHVPLLSPLTTSPGTQSQATRFLWSNRPTSSSDGQTTPNAGFTSIAPPLPSPTSLNKPFLGSAFQLVTSPPGSAPLQRPPSLQDLSSGEIGRPHPPS